MFRLDIFPKDIRVNYNGKDQYRTIVGSVVSLLTLSGIFIIFFIAMIKHFGNKDHIWSQTVNYVNLENDDTLITLGQDSPKFMIKYLFDPEGTYPDTIDAEDYSKYVRMWHRNFQFEGSYFINSHKPILNTKDIDIYGGNTYYDCRDHFDIHLLDATPSESIFQYYCPDMSKYELGGNDFNSKTYHIGITRVAPCSSG